MVPIAPEQERQQRIQYFNSHLDEMVEVRQRLVEKIDRLKEHLAVAEYELLTCNDTITTINALRREESERA